MEEVKRFATSSKYCDQCLKLSLNTHRCYSCHSAQYCSEECRVKDLGWHKTVCETWAKDETRKMPDRKEQKNKAMKRVKDLEKKNTRLGNDLIAANTRETERATSEVTPVSKASPAKGRDSMKENSCDAESKKKAKRPKTERETRKKEDKERGGKER